MTQIAISPPATLEAAIEQFSAIIGNKNATLIALRAAPSPDELMQKMKDALRPLGIIQFSQLVRWKEQANISVVLYAGDGIVVKITHIQHKPFHFRALPLPHQLPPLYRTKCNDFIVEAFPWVSTQQMKMQHVETIKAVLLKKKQEFTYKQDMYPRNIGIMPNNELVVIDNGALKMQDGNRASWPHLHQWMHHIYQVFNPLYTMQDLNPESIPVFVGTEPKFTPGFSPLLSQHYIHTMVS